MERKLGQYAYGTTLNEKSFLPMSRGSYVRDISSVSDLGSLVFWQEAGWLLRVRRLIRELMPHDSRGRRWGHHFPGGSTGISFDWRRWHPKHRGRVLLHEAVRGVCDTRYIAELLAVESSTDALVALGSAHWSPKRGGLGVPAQRRGNTAARNWIYRQVKADRPSILAGDANQQGAFLGGEVNGEPLLYVHGDTKIDHLIFVGSASWKWEVDRRRVFRMRSDHDAVRVRFRLVRR